MNSSLPPSMELENGNGMDVGGLLKASRMRRNEALSDVAKILRIRLVYMEAIEDGRFDDLPGNTYAVGFIRSYSEHLGLDGDEIVRRLKSEASETDKNQNLSFPTVVQENGIPRGAIVMVGLLIAVFGYGSWYFVSTQESFTTEQVTPVPAEIAKVVEELSPRIEPSSAAASPVQPLSKIETQSPSMKPEIQALMPTEPAQEFPQSDQKIKIEDTLGQTPASPEEPVVEQNATTPNVAAAEENPVQATPEVTPPAAPQPEASGDDQTLKPDPVQSSFDDVVPGGVVASEAPRRRVKQPEVSPPEIPAVPQTEAPDSGLVDLTEAPDTPETPAVSDTAPITETPAEPVEVATAPVSTKSRITVRAAGVSWIQIRDNSANKILEMKLLQRGESYDVPNQEDLSMGTGNAGVLEITVDGAKVPTVGPVGAVRRNILLDVDRLRNGTAVIK